MTVSDTRSAVALAKEIPALLEAGIMVESGGHGLLTFRRQDLIVVSPGVPMDTPEVKQVVAFGLPVIGELELASRYLQGRGGGDYGVEWEDHDNDAGGEDLCRCGSADAGGWEYRVAGDRSGGEEYGGDGERAGGVELSVGDGGGVSSADCGGAEHYAGPSGPAWEL